MRLSGFRDELTLCVFSFVELSLLELSFAELPVEELSLAEPSFDELSDLGLSSFFKSFPPPSEEGALDFFA